MFLSLNFDYIRNTHFMRRIIPITNINKIIIKSIEIFIAKS